MPKPPHGNVLGCWSHAQLTDTLQKIQKRFAIGETLECAVSSIRYKAVTRDSLETPCPRSIDQGQDVLTADVICLVFGDGEVLDVIVI